LALDSSLSSDWPVRASKYQQHVKSFKRNLEKEKKELVEEVEEPMGFQVH
jgi:hypothetical protein